MTTARNQVNKESLTEVFFRIGQSVESALTSGVDPESLFSDPTWSNTSICQLPDAIRLMARASSPACSPHDLDDIASDVLLSTRKSVVAEKNKTIQSWGSYLYIVVRNEVNRCFGRLKKQNLPTSAPDVSYEVDPASPLLDSERREAIAEFIMGQSLLDRTIFSHREIGTSNKDIAAMVGRDVATTSGRYRQLIDELKAFLQRKGLLDD